MRERRTSITLVTALILSLLLPSHAQAIAPGSIPLQTARQGEIAYILDGDIWLLDLFTGESQQLTTDGDNRWPTWSTDGRYLLYTHGNMEETADLYILEVGQGEPRLLVENACCAAWEPDGDRIAYIALAGGELAIEAVRPDGSGKETLFAPLQYGRSSWPTGNMLWLPETGGILAPLEVIENSVQARLITYESIFIVDLRDAKLEPIHLEKGVECSIRNPAFGINTLAFEFEGNPGCVEGTTSAKGIAIGDRGFVEVPWLAYPSGSSDGQFLVAERYAEATDPAEAARQGIVLYNPSDETEQMLVEGGAQPAWRPAPLVDPAVARYIQPGERVVTIQPALSYGGSAYQVHYLATGNYTKTDASLFIAPTPEFFVNQGITALIVTKDGQVVTDAEMLRQVFLLYTAAYYLYEQPPQEFVPAGREELGNVLNNPVFQALSVGELLRTPRAQTAETLRAMLTDRVSEQTTLEPLFDQAFATVPKRAEDALDAFSAVVENQAAHNAVLIALKPDLAAAYTNLGDTVKGSKYELQLVRLALQLLFTSHLQAERASWLESYAGTFANGAGSLDRTQLNAAVDVLAEVQSSNQQRIDIAADFMTQMSGQAILDLSGAAATKAVTQLLAQVGEKFGVRLASNAVAGTLAAVSVGTSLGNLLYGSDELFANFTLAQRADELRTTFQAGRAALQEKAAFDQANVPDTLAYNGDLAAQFRAAYLLEILAAVQTQRAYADGAAATIRLPNLLEVITNLLGQDWKTAVQGLQQRADEIEIKALNEVGAPAYLETAIGLALSRMPKGPTVIVGTPVEPELPKLHPEWTSYTNGNYVNDLLVLGDTIWAATNGGVVRWDIDDNSYVKYTREYGLADNNVTSVVQSTDGTLWFGTGSGVSRLDDNNHWTTFTTDNGLVANDILDIVQSTDGTLWFNTSHGISRLDTSGRWTTFTSENRLAGKEVMSVVGNVGDSLWFNTNDGVSRLDTTNLWTTFTITDGLVSNAVGTIIQSTDGSLWFGGSSGVSQLSTDGQWSTFTSKDGLVDDGRTHITAIIQSADGALWFGAGTGLPFDEYGEVNRLNKDGRWTTLTHEDGLANNNIQAIAEGSDGSLWFGTRGGGISRLDHSGLWTTYTTKDGLAGNSISTIFQSTDGLLWFGIGQPLRYFRGGSGVSRLVIDGRWTTLTTKDGLVNNNVNSIIQSTDGALWFGTFEIKSASEGLISVGGVSRLDIDGTWTTFTTKDGLADNAIASMIQSTDGSIWFAMVRSAGVSRLDTKGQWTTFTTNNGLVDNNVQAILQSADGNLWFATYDKGVSRLGMDGRWTTFTTKDGLVGNSMLSIAQSADGALWFSAVNLDTRSTGVSRLDTDGQWTTFMTKDALPINAVSSIVQSTDGAMWFGMYEGGVSRLGKDGRWTTFTTKDGPSQQ